MNNNTKWDNCDFKLSTGRSLFEKEKYAKIVDETLAEVTTLNSSTSREKWEVFMMVMKTTSVR